MKAIINQESREPSIRLEDVVSQELPRDPRKVIDTQEKDGYCSSKHYARVKLTFPIDWSMNPFSDAHWAFQLNAMRPAVPYLFAHAKHPSIQYLTRAVDYFLDWQRFNITDGRPNKYKWYNMAVGQRAARLAYTLSQACKHSHSIGLARIEGLTQLALDHIDELMQPDRVSRGNHGLFQMHGLMALGRVLREYHEGRDAMEFARSTLDRLALLQFSDEGVHLEHSPAYHFFATRVLTTIYRTGWYDNDAHFNRHRDLIQAAAAWLVDPLGSVVAIGDSHCQKKDVPPPDGEPALFGPSPWPNAVVKHWSKTGYSIIRSSPDAPARDSYMLFFTGAHHSSVHKHSDDLHLNWFDRGCHILVDSGAYCYKRDRMRQYVLSTRAHNTIECNGTSSPRSKDYCYGSSLLAPRYHTWGAELSGRVAHPTLGFVHYRRVFFAPGRFLAVVDTVESRQEAEYVQWWHFDPSLSLSRDASGFIVRDSCGSPMVWVHTLSPIESCAIAYGEIHPRLQGWVCTSYKTMMPAYTLGIQEKGRHVRFTTIFCLDQAEMKNAEILVKRVGEAQ